MGKKINPKVIRLGITRTWHSRWFSHGQEYIKNVEQDIKIRRYIMRQMREAGIDKVEIERNANKINIGIYTAKPGLIIARGGSGIEELKKKIHSQFLKNFRPGQININIYEVDRANLSAQIIVQSMIGDIEKRLPFRRVMKQAMNRVQRAGALGVKTKMSGRLNGAEIAREETLSAGKVPLHTLRADIDYARGTAQTTYGAIGVKIWIYKGDKFEKDKENKGEVVRVKSVVK